MNRSDIRVGQIVWLNHGKVGGKTLVRVEKVNPKNIKVAEQNGTLWNCHPTFLSHADADEQASFAKQPEGQQLTLGAVVRFLPGSPQERRWPQYRDLVVIANKAGLFSLAPLGGDSGKYIRGISSTALVVQAVEVV